MEIDTPTRPDRVVKAEDGGHDKIGDTKPSYKSWKKKYRKMRVVFDRKIQESEELLRLEQKALETANRLAVENDQLLDLLLDVNNCPQIPPDRRIDLSLDPAAVEDGLHLEIDRPNNPNRAKAGTKSYKQLLSEVPHFGFASAAGRVSNIALGDLNTGRDSPVDPQQGAPHPPTFLTADDIDNYIYEIDVRLAAQRTRSESPVELLPTLAPAAGTNGQPPGKDVDPATLLETLRNAGSTHSLSNQPHAPTTSSSAARDLALRNPTSVYNWLRKHAPKTFLQDHEISAADHANASEEPAHAGASSRGGGRGSRGGGHADRNERGSVRGSARAKKPLPRKWGEYMPKDDADPSSDFATPEAKKGGGKRKRVVDDDPGYRPKGGSSRPAKKKRKSAGAGGVEDAGPISAALFKKLPRRTPGSFPPRDLVDEGDGEGEAEADGDGDGDADGGGEAITAKAEDE